MKKWKHLNLENRKIIANSLAHNYNLITIGDLIGCDPTTISKEVKRNRILISEGHLKECCPKTNRWPYVCNNCTKRYQYCDYNKYRYEASNAQKKADEKLVLSRKGIDLTEEEFTNIDIAISKGLEENKSIYQIKIENNIDKSITSLYRYINSDMLTVKRHNLPYAGRYKKRKHNKKYEYSNNQIDRSNHTYLDYLSYKYSHPNCVTWELDFLGAIKTDSYSILTLIQTELHYTLLDFIKKPDSNKIVELFDNIELLIGTENFIKIFEVILTDRDPNFTDIDGISFSKITGEVRCHLFFCDPYVSNQKPHVENMNKQIRKFFPKGKSIDKYTRKEIKEINYILNNAPLKSLDGYTPNEVFSKIYTQELLNKLLK